VRDGKPCVLCVEDESAIRELFRVRLGVQGFDVVAVPDGGSAVVFMTENPGVVDFATIDFVVPPVDGLYILKEIRKVEPNISAAFVSGYCSSRVEELRSYGAEVFEKPVDFDALIRLINDAVEQKRV
jgi:DNA-binding NtrC family response regulator